MSLAYLGDDRVISLRGSISLNDGTTLSLDGGNIIDYQISEQCTGGQEFTVGDTRAATFRLTVADEAHALTVAKLLGAQVSVESKLSGASAWDRLGVWFIDDCDISRQSAAVSISGSDALATKFEAPWTDGTYPATLGTLLTRAATLAGVTTANAGSFRHYSRSVSAAPEWPDGTTVRKVVGWIAQCAGGFARINRAGKLEIFAYDPSASSEAIGPDDFYRLRLGSGGTFAFNTVLVMDMGETEYVRYPVDSSVEDSASNAIRIARNPLMTPTIATALRTALTGLSMQAARVEWVGDPTVCCGSVLSITDTDDAVYSAMITEQTISISSGMSASSACEMPSPLGNTYSSGAAFTPDGTINSRAIADKSIGLDKLSLTARQTIAQEITELITGDFADIKRGMTVSEAISLTFVNGGISSATGGNSSTNQSIRLRTNAYTWTGMGVTVTLPSNLRGYIFTYSDAASSSFIGASGWQTGTIEVPELVYFRIVVAFTDDAQIVPADAAGVAIWRANATDTSLTIPEKAADAKAVGDIFADTVRFVSILSDEDDLNDVIDTGVYRWIATSVPDNAPVTATGGHLIVGGRGVRWQLVISYAGTIYARNRTSDGTYSNWIATANKLGTLDHTVALSDADDLDALDSTGIYQYFSSSVPDNAPDGVGAVLICAKYDSTYSVQAAVNIRGSVFIRMRASAGWTNWLDAAYPKDRVHINATKGAWTKNGVIQTSGVKGVCNDTLLVCVPGSALSFYIDRHWTYSIREGDSPTNLFVRTAHLSKNARHIVTYPYVALMFNEWDSNDEDTINITAADFDQSVIVHTSGAAVDNTIIETDTHDAPENAGVLAVISRAYQMSKIRFTALATLPMHTGGSWEVTPADAAAGTDIQGVVYSSMRETMASVPQATSLHTYMTALLNPNSYIYTEHYKGHAEGGTDYNSRCYYGAVCSTLVAYCYGIEDAMPTTIAFDSYPGFEELPPEAQNPYSLKLGDSLIDSGSHIVIVTDIIRNYRGRIKSIEVTEADKPLCKTTVYTPARIQSRYFDQSFVAYRYANIASVPYTPSPWVHVDDTETAAPDYSEQLSPRKGDRANWAYGADVVIDVMDAGDHTGYSVTNRDTNTVAASGSIPSGHVITLSNLAAGRYECTLTGGTSSVTPVRFNVLATGVTYQTHSTAGAGVASGKVKALNWTLSGDPTATPTAIYWCGALSYTSDYKAVAAFHVLTAEEISAGEVTLPEPALSEEEKPHYTANGLWLMRMQWKTEYGLYATPLVAVTVT